MKLKALIAAVSVLAVTGCTTVRYNEVDKETTFDIPPVNEITTAYIGDNLVSKGVTVEQTVVDVKTTIDNLYYRIPSKEYVKVGYDGTKEFFAPDGTIHFLGDPLQALYVDSKKTGKICVVTIFGATGCYDAKVEVKPVIKVGGANCEQTLVYNGRVGDKVNVGYREFTGNVARPAFNNNVEYDMRTSTQIGYKGALLDVLKTDNSSITYRVVRNFPDTTCTVGR